MAQEQETKPHWQQLLEGCEERARAKRIEEKKRDDEARRRYEDTSDFTQCGSEMLNHEDSYLAKLLANAKSNDNMHVFYKERIINREGAYEIIRGSFGAITPDYLITSPSRNKKGDIAEFWANVMGKLTQNIVCFGFRSPEESEIANGYASVYTSGLLPRVRKDVLKKLKILGYLRQK